MANYNGAEEEMYEPQNAVEQATRASLLTGAAGLLLASVQNTVAREQVGAFGVFTKFGGTIALFTALGGTYTFASIASANLREKQDAYNSAIGGAFAGALVGMRKRTMASVTGNAALLSAALFIASYTGGTMFGNQSEEASVEAYEYKDEVRRRFRRPLNEVINELGEGRGIYGPGYEERRKQRIKENYGIDIADPFYKKSS